MLTSKTRLPFTIENLVGGFARANGVLQVVKDRLEVEFQTQDTVIGKIKSEPKMVAIPLTEIDSVAFKSNWFGASMTIRVLDLRLLQQLPKSEDSEFKIKVNKKDKDKATSLESVINLRISELKLDPQDRGDSIL
ncbi:hypothetical protein [Pontibacter sp. G13]|uniref:hypothetical protein n=1 Tax=Pontibacter sp. G13 TaxID=3074898 RepID=UPI002889B9F5|nr:hypothetical protein [Pontibacter sp. G13]WNJ17299.1 hypothetical protein RJD25_20815 [Pontibacter sp. G13]